MNRLDEILRVVGSTLGYGFGNDELTKLREINQRNIFGDTPLHYVCRWGDAEAADALIKAGADVNALGEDNQTPIFSAISNGSLDTLKVLLRAGADLSVADTAFGMTPLQYAQIPRPDRPQQIIELLEKAMSGPR
jgi:ankyrin repeat protein